MERALISNAFRLLSLPADAELKEVYSREERLKIAIGMDDTASIQHYKFLAAPALTQEDLLDAVHRIENERTRIREELFWIHELDAKLSASNLDTVATLSKFRTEARSSNTTRGAVALHNLAVILTYLALETKSGSRLDYFRDALVSWRATLKAEIFWQFLEDRVAATRNGAVAEIKEARYSVPKQLAAWLTQQIDSCLSQRDFKSVTSLIQMCIENKDWLPALHQLDQLALRLMADGSTSVGAVLDRIAAIHDSQDKAAIRKILNQADAEIQRIANTFGASLRALGVTATISQWSDVIASALEKLSIAFFNLLEDHDEALCKVVEAQSLASDPTLKARLEADWRHVKCSIFCDEAGKLIKAGKFQEAEAQLGEALSIATEPGKVEINQMLEACQRARVFKDVDHTENTPSLFMLNGIGATFYGRRDSDNNSQSYVTNHWFTFLFLPIFPLGSYRVSDSGRNSYRVYGRVPLSPFLKKYRWGVAAAVVLLVIWANAGTSGGPPVQSSTPAPTPSYQTESQGAPSTSFPGAMTPTDSRSQESRAIEQERATLNAVRASLDARNGALNAESNQLDRLKADVEQIESTYKADTIPDSIREELHNEVDEYNRRLFELKAAAKAYNQSVRDFEKRRARFNSRVSAYNANQ